MPLECHFQVGDYVRVKTVDQLKMVVRVDDESANDYAPDVNIDEWSSIVFGGEST